MIATISEGEVIDLWASLDSIFEMGMGVSLTYSQLDRLLKERADLILEKNNAVREHWSGEAGHGN